MTPVGFSPKQARMLDLTGIALLLALMGFGLLYQFKGWKLDGTNLVGVCIVIINYVNLFRGQIGQAAARIDELEKQLSAMAAV